MRRTLLALSSVSLLGLLLVGCGDADTSSNDTPGGSEPTGDTVCATTDAKDDLWHRSATRACSRCRRTRRTRRNRSTCPRRTSTKASTSTWPLRSPTRLGVEIAWEDPEWEVITAGGWNGRWDMSVGSMLPTNDRQKVLDFTEPYYFTPAVILVNSDNTSIQDLTTDLDGKKIGVCSGCTYEQFLDKSLEVAGYTFDFVVDDAEPVATTPTRPRCRTLHSVTATDWMP